MATKKLNWLDEVKADAEYLFKKRQREAEEDRKFEESKRGVADPAPGEGSTYEPEDKKGKQKWQLTQKALATASMLM